MKNKSQYSMEFLIFFALISIIFFVWLIIYSDLNEEAVIARDKRAIMDVGKAIQTHIFLAANAHNGYLSEKLVILQKAGAVEYGLETTNYVFTLSTEKNQINFHIPYTLGRLQKGVNVIKNVCGIVVLGNYSPIVDDQCFVRLSNCSNWIDDDNDGLIDAGDGGCYKDNDNAYYDGNWDNETATCPSKCPPLGQDVYNFYPICKQANETAGFCQFLDIFGDGVVLPTCKNCRDYTHERFCEEFC